MTSRHFDTLQAHYGIGYTTVLRLSLHPDYLAARAERTTAYQAWNSVRRTQGDTAAYQCAEYKEFKRAESEQLSAIASMVQKETGIEIRSTEHLQCLRDAMLHCQPMQGAYMSPN
jgi:hypothetical protein